MPVRLSYVNARGNEIILDDDERSFLGELMGREGFEAPPVDLTTVTYGNGNEEVISAAFKRRELTCQFWVETMSRAVFEHRFRALKSGLIQVGKHPGNWGKLRVLRADGTYAAINCIYSEGLDSMAYDSSMRRWFSLTFTAADPYFYDETDTVRSFSTYRVGHYLWFRNVFHFGSGTWFRSSGMAHTELITLDSSRAYPLITITGPGRALKLSNESAERWIELEPGFNLLAGERLVINTKPMEREVIWYRLDGSEVNGLKFLTPDSTLDWYLENGENEVVFRNSIHHPDSLCTLRYQCGWLGV